MTAEPFRPDQTRTFEHALFLYRGDTKTVLEYSRRFFSMLLVIDTPLFTYLILLKLLLKCESGHVHPVPRAKTRDQRYVEKKHHAISGQ